MPDDVCGEHADRGVKVSISLLDEGMVLVEGDRASLEFLAAVIHAQAGYGADCGFFIGPRGPGNAFFAAGSKLGIYIHRTGECTHEPA
jgi:hypothetical protein